MLFSRFSIQLIIRTLLLLANAFALAFVLSLNDTLAISVFMSLLICLQVYLLRQYVNKTNQKLAMFLVNIKNQGSFDNFRKGSKIDYLQEPELVFDHINAILKKNKIKQLEQEQLLQLMINKLDTAYYLCDKEGEVILQNQAFLKLEEEYQELHQQSLTLEVQKCQPGNEQQIRFAHVNHTQEYLLQCTEMKLQDKKLLIYILQNINQALDKKETESYSKLIRVLTHEMMNSLTPIMSLSKSLRRYFSKGNQPKTQSELSDELIIDALKNIELILDRGEKLQSFIQSYKLLSKFQQAKPETISLQELINKQAQLFAPEFEKTQIQFNSNITKNMHIHCDLVHAEHIISNLLKNAIEALEDSSLREIEISTRESEQQILLCIRDTGKGMDASLREQIFTPFYTTKENGNGIGLALCKQLLNLNKGDLFVNSAPNKGTEFCIAFRR